MDYESTRDYLTKLGQVHLLDYYGELDEEKRKILLQDIEKVNFSVVGNINNKEHKTGGNISPVRAASLEDIAENSDKYNSEGIKLLSQNKVAAVLLAGGQGTRLGFKKPKGMFDIGETKHVSIFELLMNNVKATANRCGLNFHLFIMTSSINNKDTVEFFRQNNYFGYPADKIHFYIQDTEPACDFEGKVFLSEKHRVLLSPNGNGGWYSSLVNSGLGEVLEREKIEWINVFGVDNVLQQICDPAFIGATSLAGYPCGAKVVKKTCAEEKVGVLCEQDGKPAIVEYYEMPPELARLTDKDGELVYKYGVILNYLFGVKELNKTITDKLPYHLAVKAIPHISGGKLVEPVEPNGYKFETLVVDMVKKMGNCLAYEVVREREFAPVKNKAGADSIDTARALLKSNGIII